MARVRLPPPDVPMIDITTGRLTVDYYDFFKNLERLKLIDLADVTTAAPADTNTVRYSASTKTWNFGA